MTYQRFAAHKDRNHTEIVTALRQVGASVLAVDAKDAPDLVVGFRGTDRLLELKSPEILAPGLRGMKIIQRAGKLSPGQAAWHAAWRGRKPAIVHTTAEALAAIGVGLPDSLPALPLEVAEFLAKVAGLADCGDGLAEGLAQEAMHLIRKARAA